MQRSLAYLNQVLKLLLNRHILILKALRQAALHERVELNGAPRSVAHADPCILLVGFRHESRPRAHGCDCCAAYAQAGSEVA